MAIPAPIQKTVDDLITSNAVVIFSKSYCPYCRATKELFKQKGVDGVFLELDLAENGDALQSAVQATTIAPGTARSVPQVFISQKRIGGNDAVQALDKKGGLDPLIEDVEKGGLREVKA